MIKKFLLCLCVFTMWSTISLADTNPVIKHIRINGLRRITHATVIHYLPVGVGDHLTTQNSSESVRKLYATGFFDDVSVRQAGDTLIVDVVERPTIASIRIIGNKLISRDKIQSVLKTVGLSEGWVYSPSAVSKVKSALLDEYQRIGRYGAEVIVKVNPRETGAIDVVIDINEGKLAKVVSINIVGNQAFKTRKLLHQLQLSSGNLLTFFTHKNRFSQEKLDASLAALQLFYLNHGYLKFKVVDTQVKRIADHSKVDITITVSEGAQYRLKDYKFTGQLIIPPGELAKLVTLKSGDIFARDKIQESITAIGRALGNKGYGYARVNAIPTLYDDQRQASLDFNIEPGRRIYVRHINFKGNIKTADNVLRHAMRQEEGSLMSVDSIDESQRQLRLLNYIQDAAVKTTPVPGTNNQVDLDVDVTEAPGAEAVAAVGYGTDGLLFDARLNQSNFLGTGKQVGVGFRESRRVTSYNFNYYNPFYTPDGVGRGFDAFYEKITPGDIDLANYTTARFGGNVNYGYALNDKQSVRFSAGYSDLHITSLSSRPSTQIQNFVNREGDRFREVRLGGTWVHNGYDRFPMPTKGLRQEVNVLLALPAGADALTYTKTNYQAHWFLPLIKGFILSTRGGVGYGRGFGDDQELPFFENYLAGGLIDFGRVRGFDNYSLGPRDSRDEPIGGNLLVNGGMALIVPNFVSENKLRTSLFLDTGNVYNRGGTDFPGTSSGPLRYSAGIGVQWRSPLGPLEFSIAEPLNRQPGDRTRIFDFNIALPF
ncbi:MAG: outer membrane protein assembly factor BamA [Gammaproteobacteria bacterium]